MKINTVVIEPRGSQYTHFLYDPIRLIQLGLDSLGHDCTLSKNHFDTSRLNLVIGGHQITDPAAVNSIVGSGVPYVMLQSEVIRGGQVNSSGEEHWRRCYLPLLRGARRVWDWSPETVGELEKLGIRGDYCELGYHPGMQEIHHKQVKNIDVLWYGSVTPYRQAILEQVAARGVPMHLMFDDVSFYRNDLIARAKIILTLQQYAGNHVPYGRILYAVTNRCLVAGESPDVPHWSEALYEGAPADRVADLLVDLLARTDRDALVEAHLDALKRRPMTGILEPLLDRLAP